MRESTVSWKSARSDTDTGTGKATCSLCVIVSSRYTVESRKDRVKHLNVIPDPVLRALKCKTGHQSQVKYLAQLLILAQIVDVTMKSLISVRPERQRPCGRPMFKGQTEVRGLPRVISNLHSRPFPREGSVRHDRSCRRRRNCSHLLPTSRLKTC